MKFAMYKSHLNGIFALFYGFSIYTLPSNVAENWQTELADENYGLWLISV